MKPAPSALVNLLAGGVFVMADLYTFELVIGAEFSSPTSLYYAASDIDVSWNGSYTAPAAGNLFGSKGARFERSQKHAKASWKTGVEVGTLDFDVFPQPGVDMVLNRYFLDAVRAGLFDGATLSLDRAFFAAWPQPPQAVPLVPAGVANVFFGRVVEVTATRAGATFSINDPRELLNIKMPRRLYQPGCVHTLFDAGCTVSKSAYLATGTVSYAVNAGNLYTSVTSQADSYYALGAIVFTSGINQGLARTIKTSKQANGELQLLSPFPNVPQPGDGFTMYPGCDKTILTCTQKFANLANFLATPFMPTPETAI
jgi:uncharacterized phage protein (TIGR02218 family)